MAALATNTPPLPPGEDSNSTRTLPSIQSLIGTTDNSGSKREQQAGSERQQHPQASPIEQRPSGEYPRQSYAQPTVSNRTTLPPTPPVRADIEFDPSLQSPSDILSHSSNAAPQYFGPPINNTEPHEQLQRHPSTTDNRPQGHSGSSRSPYGPSPYATSPGSITTYSYPSPATQQGHPYLSPVIAHTQNYPSPSAPNPAYFKRPVPSTFPPSNFPPTTNSTLSPTHVQPSPHQSISPIDSQPNLWQHHHYISPSSSASFASQSQDRYICQTCNKAFSRPSSLRIHSHSHTGEKPFKCPSKGCGKAFSVRSNMKRHERGCHGGGGGGGGSEGSG